MATYVKDNIRIEINGTHVCGYIDGEQATETDIENKTEYIRDLMDNGYDEVFYIFEGHMDALRKKVTRIQNKCKKFGCDFHFEEIGSEIKPVATNELNEDGTPKFENCNFIIVKAHGTAIVNGWEFVASVEHTEAGNIFSKALSDVQIPKKYYASKCYCEHCNTNRTRKDTFIIRNAETGEFKQIGRNCLNDYTHGLSVQTASFFASIKDIFDEEEQRPIGGLAWYERHYETREILQYAAETIRCFGYTKGDADTQSTKGLMGNIIDFEHGNLRYWERKDVEALSFKLKRAGFDHNSSESNKAVDTVLEWIGNQPDEGDYMHNLKVVTSLHYCKAHNFGLLVSVFPAYNRDLEEQDRRRREAEVGKLSQHVGEVGKHIEVEIEKVKCLTSWESCYNGYSTQTTFIWGMTDKNGNVFTWKTSNWLDTDSKYTIKGTVKEHKEYRGVKQTELTRCRVTEHEEEIPHVAAPAGEFADNPTQKSEVDEALDLFFEYAS